MVIPLGNFQQRKKQF